MKLVPIILALALVACSVTPTPSPAPLPTPTASPTPAPIPGGKATCEDMWEDQYGVTCNGYRCAPDTDECDENSCSCTIASPSAREEINHELTHFDIWDIVIAVLAGVT